MLSDFREYDKIFAISAGYSYTRSGESSYRNYLLGARYRPFDWLQFTGSIPYSIVEGTEEFWEWWEDPLGNRVEKHYEFNYRERGFGDAVVMAWLNGLYPLFDEKSDSCTAPGSAGLEGIDDPAIYLGAGVKFATGTDDEVDPDKLNYDQGPRHNPYGETSESAGVLPARFQLGTGTTDLLFSVVYQQRFGRFVPTAGISYQFAGGENSVGYERGDRYSWSAGAKIIFVRTEDCRELFVSAALSGVTTLDYDIDHSEDTALIGYQEKGEVDGTKGTWTFYSFGAGYDLTPDLTLSAGITLPLTQPDDDGGDDVTSYDFDVQYGVGLQFRF